MIGVINYQPGNLTSVFNVLRAIGAEANKFHFTEMSCQQAKRDLVAPGITMRDSEGFARNGLPPPQTPASPAIDCRKKGWQFERRLSDLA